MNSLTPPAIVVNVPASHMAHLNDFALALAEAAPPYLVGVIHAEKGELPDTSLYGWEGDQAEYMQGFEETAAEIERQRQERPKPARRILTDAEIEAERYDMAEHMIDEMFRRYGSY